MAPHRVQERAGSGETKAVSVSRRSHARASARTLRLIEETHDELGYYANSISRWLHEQDLSCAEAMFMLSSVMACGLEEAWPDAAHRPKQIVTLLEALDGAGDLLGSLSILARAQPGDLDETQ